MAAQDGRGPIDWLVNAGIRAALGVTFALPYAWRVPAAGWVASRLIAPVAGYSARVRENLALVLPDLPDSEIRRLMRKVPDNVGRTLIEIYSGRPFIDRAAATEPRGAGVAALEAAQAKGRPVILVTGHIGNYDALRANLIARGHTVGALYMKMRNAWFNDHYVAAISKIGTPLFPRGRDGLSGMVRFLKGGGVLGLLIDQRMGHGERLSFFGRDALTAVSAAELALKYDALMLPAYAFRKDGLDFDILIEGPIPHGTPQEMTQALNDSLEAVARDHLDQYFWIHRRWKMPRGKEDTGGDRG
jgi:KDO2-lipid IV(A) lauroyltransferase